MCTMVWGEDSGKLWICFNRDEQRSRPLAQDFALHDGPIGPIAYARDSKGGGTWFAASSRGFVVALLNHYPPGGTAAPENPRSRGLLVLDLAGCASADEAAEQLDSLDPGCYQPFLLEIFTCESGLSCGWDGEVLSYFMKNPDCMNTTSSYQPAVVAKWRQEWWRHLRSQSPGPDVVARQLRKTNPGKPAFGVTMDRDDARTVSQIQFELCPDSFRALYRAREPDGPGYTEPTELRYPE